MASSLGRGCLAWPWVMLTLLAWLQCSVAQFCSFWNTGCIDPLAQTAVRFDLSPLFFDPVTLYYAFDTNPTGKGEGPMTKTAYWLGYKNSNINDYGIDSNYTSEIALRVGNLTGTPSGTNNGCDGIWGPPCSQDIKVALQNTIFHLTSSDEYCLRPLEIALSQFLTSPPSLPSCGAPVFDVVSIPVQDFAFESTASSNVTLMTPGSGDHPWQVWYLDMTAKKQASQVAVGIISRAPVYNSAPPQKPEEIQIELVCLQAPQGSQSGSGDHD
ncbi:uncharacterized protein N7459_004374 [Penicillium hispanicum]|uniref:uncharacterized protein n=1 Tax=Penicillium hispanicum TaxID=1080232 RepID=UPI00254254BA|nr:uncharacterized protein N7459_004374 [Penicillium hispanicum]KAJ5584574.1 hypothetical protein N7459_004374 [Penicillium hispanicum]